MRNTVIARNGTATTVTLVMIENRGFIIVNNLGGAISRAVVDNDDFQILVSLRKDAVKRLTNKLLSIKRRNDNGNQGIDGHRASLFLKWPQHIEAESSAKPTGKCVQ